MDMIVVSGSPMDYNYRTMTSRWWENIRPEEYWCDERFVPYFCDPQHHEEFLCEINLIEDPKYIKPGFQPPKTIYNVMVIWARKFLREWFWLVKRYWISFDDREKDRNDMETTFVSTAVEYIMNQYDHRFKPPKKKDSILSRIKPRSANEDPLRFQRRILAYLCPNANYAFLMRISEDTGIGERTLKVIPIFQFAWSKYYIQNQTPPYPTEIKKLLEVVKANDPNFKQIRIPTIKEIWNVYEVLGRGAQPETYQEFLLSGKLLSEFHQSERLGVGDPLDSMKEDAFEEPFNKEGEVDDDVAPF
jgi:hypothetical protein